MKKEKGVLTENFEVFQKLIERDGANCSYCCKPLEATKMNIEYTFPVFMGGSDDLDNLRLICDVCNLEPRNSAIRGFEFELFIGEIIKSNPAYRVIRRGVSKTFHNGKEYTFDLLVERKRNNSIQKYYIQVKYLTSYIYSRIKTIVDEYKNFKAGDKEHIVLIIPGVLTEKSQKLITESNVEIWDRDFLVSEFYTGIKNSKHPAFINLLLLEPTKKNIEEELIFRLQSCSQGAAEWSLYQKLVGDIFTHVFCPPLENPIQESSDLTSVNRRDLIYPNYCDTGFWKFIRDTYKADYIVVDAKNYSKVITKKEILQIANYLKEYGTGLFGVIVTRKGASNSAVITQREMWILHKKLIIVLDDNDVQQMLIEKNQWVDLKLF
ncbi:HNH endonuclease [Bacillus mycoides]|uniref:HNH endonuclease n=1 Tax=Bacillus mycoides TaxID=1405 RepID=A0A4U3AGL8_BACMY|nr:HNH endonuclease [Bacillus mycoides]TKI86360.1 HNH endonuclease [Bacillus mycoides]